MSGVFNPGPEWGDVPPGAVLPSGCEIEMNMATGQQRARRADADAQQVNGGDNVARLADRDQIARFVDALFRYATEGTHIALHSFYHDPRRPPADARKHRLQSIEALVRMAAQRASYVANLPEPTVFAPPICTFVTSSSAAEANLAEGLALSVECDAKPEAAREVIEGLLGQSTIVVASGGEWADPTSGEVHDKLHLHWRLAEPTSETSDHQRLKRARKLAALIADSDTTAVPMVHPLRWPGTWHLKNQPKLARIVECNPDRELHLEDALDALEVAANMRDIPLDDQPHRTSNNTALAEDDDLTALAAAIPNGEDTPWDLYNSVGMAFWAASGGSEAGRAAYKMWADKSPKSHGGADARWDHFATSPPTKLTVGKLVYLARQSEPGFRLPSWDKCAGDGEPGAAREPGDALYDFSHDGLALDMGRQWNRNACHVALWGRWLFWAGDHWKPDEQLLHMTRTRDYLRARADALVRDTKSGKITWGDLDPEKAVAAAEALAKQLRTAPMINNVVSLARSNAELAASVEQWDGDLFTIGSPKGNVQ